MTNPRDEQDRRPLRVLLVGNILHLVSGHSRPAWQIARRLADGGHHPTLVTSSMDPATRRRHETLVRQEGYADLWDTHVEFSYRRLCVGDRAVRRLLAPHLEQADIIHFFDARTLHVIRRKYGAGTSARFVLSMTSLPGLTLRHLRDAGLGAVHKTITDWRHFTAGIAPDRLVRFVLGAADHIVWSSRFLMEFGRERYRIPAERQSVIDPGTDLLPHHPVEPDEQFDFIYFGWPGAHRGTLDAAEAMIEFRRLHRDARCLVGALVGGGPLGEKRRVMRTLRRRVAPTGVRVDGFRPDMRGILANARAALLPFRSPFGYVQPPLVVLESLAAGAPVISTDVGSVGDIIRDGENGFLVQPRDVGAMVTRMQALWEDDGTRERMSAAARASIADRFTVDAMFGSTLRLYHRLMADASLRVAEAGACP